MSLLPIFNFIRRDLKHPIAGSIVSVLRGNVAGSKLGLRKQRRADGRGPHVIREEADARALTAACFGLTRFSLGMS
jgi:hypothetical protein